MVAGTLTVQDVIDRVQRTFGDESSAQVTQADILRWINDAQREAVMQNEGLHPTVGYISTVAGTKEYTLPTDLFVLTHVYVRDSVSNSYYPMAYKSLKEFEDAAGGWDGSTLQSYPLIFSQQAENMVVIYPAPAASVANGLKLIYSRYATDVTGTGSTIDLPPYLHTYVVNFCLMQAYEMDEDWESATQKGQQIQGDLDFNNNRRAWFGRETYPIIGTEDEESYD